MACGNCSNCGESSKGASQRSYVAYIQPCGAGPGKDPLNAMVDGNYSSAIKVTGGTRQIRGSRTAKRKRTSSGSTKLCYYTESSPGENTVSLEFASCGCGGYSPEELAAEGTFDLYQMQACCGSADMNSGWSKMHVMRCISFNSLSFGDQTSYDPDDDNDLVHTFDANYVDDYYLYPMSLGEILAGSGLDVGARINSLYFYSNSSSCKTSCKDDCAGHWYAVTNEGTIIYRNGSDKPIKSVSIPGFTATNNAQLTMIGDMLVVSGANAYYTSTINTTTGAPGNFTSHALGSFVADGVFSNGTNAYLYGLGTNSLYQINSNGASTPAFTLPSGVSMTGYDQCGSTSAAVDSTGKVYIGSTCTSLSQTATQPTATGVNTAVAVRPGGDVWVGNASGQLFYTDDDGATWTQVQIPCSGAIRDIKWMDAGVGYVITPTGVCSTADGGNTWSANDGSGRIDTVGGVSSFQSASIPCCTSKTKQMNNIMLAGVTSANAGGMWQGSISSCS